MGVNVDHNKAFALYNDAKAKRRSGDLRGAIDLFRESLRLNPHFKSCELLGEILLEIGEAGEAVVYLAAAVSLGRNSFKAQYLLANAFLALGERSAAVVQLENVLKQNPGYVSAQILLTQLRQAGPQGALENSH